MTDFEKDDIELKPCPFCGSTDIELSMKTMGRWDVHKFHIAMASVLFMNTKVKDILVLEKRCKKKH